jgi:hypothetical protein
MMRVKISAGLDPKPCFFFLIFHKEPDLNGCSGVFFKKEDLVIKKKKTKLVATILSKRKEFKSTRFYVKVSPRLCSAR